MDIVFALAGGGGDDVVELYSHGKIVAAGKDQSEQEVVPDTGHLHEAGDDEHGQGQG
ncbi:hypothetical protein D3C72_2308840 [compost metagenome]